MKLSFSALKISFFAFLFLLSNALSAQTILHAFNWTYQEVGDKAQEIASIGYKKVLVAPPLKTDKNNCQWWARYQPQDFRTIEHCLGNKETFQYMIAALSKYGIETYADIVLNHMANERNNSTIFPGEAVVSDYANYRSYWDKQKLFGNINAGLFSAGDFHNEFCIGNYNDYYQSMNGRICGKYPDRGLPDLNPNQWVKDQQKNYLWALKNMGVKGFRIDAAKHMENWHIKELFVDSGISNGMHIFGEIIVDDRIGQNGAHDKFLSPYLSYTGLTAYDFPLFKTIRESFMPGGSLKNIAYLAYGHSLGRADAVTFTITHDIPTNDAFRYQIMDSTDEHLANVFVMGRKDGMPLILSDKTGVDNNRWYDAYNRWTIKAMIGFRNRVQGQAEETLYANDCAIMVRRGKEGFFAINKCSSDQWVNINTDSKFYWYRNYKDVFTGETIWIDKSSIWVKIPGRGSRMWRAS